jgi:hypothetical protein
MFQAADLQLHEQPEYVPDEPDSESPQRGGMKVKGLAVARVVFG